MATPPKSPPAPEPISEPWSLREPVIRRLHAAGAKLPTDRAPLDFPEPMEPAGEGPSLSEILIKDRRASR